MTSIKQSVIDRLRKVGPATVAVLSRDLGITIDQVRSSIKKLRRETPARMHVSDWALDVDRITRTGLAQVFAFGPGKDVEMPPIAEVAKRGKVDCSAVSSIFDIGMDRRVPIDSILEKNLPGLKHLLD